MSEANAMIVPMKTLGHEIEIAQAALIQSIADEEKSGYDIELTMERKYNEGFLEALEYIYILENGYGYDEH